MEEVPFDSWRRTPSSWQEARRQEVHEHKGKSAKNMGNKGNYKWFWVTLLKWAVGREKAQKKRWNHFCLLHNFAQIQAYNHSSIYIAIVLEIASSPTYTKLETSMFAKQFCLQIFFTDIYHVNMVLNGTTGFGVVHYHLLHICLSWFKSFLQELLFLLKKMSHKISISHSGFLAPPSPKQLLVL